MGNYDKYPKIKVQGWENTAICGYDGIVRFLKEKISERGNKSLIIALDTYPSVNFGAFLVEDIDLHIYYSSRCKEI